MRVTRVIFGLAAVLWVVLGPGPAQAADFPTGTYSIKIGDDTWSAKVMAGGKLTVLRNNELAVEATWKSTKEEVEFKDVSGPLAMKDDKGGKYKWKLDGNKVTFTKVEDANQGRSSALTAGAWTKQ
jgi:hypothetical protein